MNLSPPTHLLSIEYNTLDDLINAVQLHASSEGYAVTRLRTKKSYSTGLTEICYLCCNRGRKEHIPTRQKRKYSNTCTNNCPFSIVAKF